MREIADVGFEKRHPARRVDRFKYEGRSRPQLLIRQLQYAYQIRGLEMFHDLYGAEAAQAGVVASLQKRQRVGPFNLEPP